MPALRVLVTGGRGQLASALAAINGLNVRRIGRPEFDFDQPATVDAILRDSDTDLIVNAAAYTAVDAAESDRDAAWRANADGPAQLAALAAMHGLPLIHVSTDYVFDGSKGEPYTETDPVAPRSVYGASKLAGEQAVLASGASAVVLRTSWVYAPVGTNFVRTILNAARARKTLRVVADQRGCPTAAADLAAAIAAMIDRIAAEGWQDRFGGVYHVAGSGWTTWHGLATAAVEIAASHGLAAPEVEPIGTADWPTPAPRPADARLDCAKFAAMFYHDLPPWRETLERTVPAIVRDLTAT